MAVVLKPILRLPPCLRQQIVFQEHSASFASSRRLVSNSLDCLQSRYITRNATNTKATTSKTRKNTLPPPPRPPPARDVTPYATHIRSLNSALNPAPLPRKSPRDALHNLPDWKRHVLLYKSTHHGPFFISSYFMGGVLVLGAYLHSQSLLKDPEDGPKRPWITKALGTISVLFVTAMATVILLAPMKMIKSISLVSPRGSGDVRGLSKTLRFEVKRALPMLKPFTVEANPLDVVLDRSVPGTLTQLKYTNIPVEDTVAFTERYFSDAKPAKEQGILSKVALFNKAFTRTWPALKRETKRMCLRDQMAYVRITGIGNFKLDLQDCVLLDGGRPFVKLMTTDLGSSSSRSMSIWEKLRLITKG